MSSSSSRDDELVKIYEQVLRGKRIKGRHLNTNLYIIDTAPTSRIERAEENEICPPTNLNPEFLYDELDSKARAAKQKEKQQNSKNKTIDKALLAYLKKK